MGTGNCDTTNTLELTPQHSLERMDEEDVPTAPVDLDQDEDPDYKAPPERSIDEMLAVDKEDTSLQQYKATLLGSAAAGTGAVVVDQNNPNKVIVKALSLVVEGRDDVTMDLTEDIAVQREIVHGLKYVQKTYRAGIPVDKMTHMVGSYPPKLEAFSTLTPLEDAPSGMMKRGTYSVHSLFTDDDKSEHLKWEWSIEIKKDWD